MYNYSSQPLKTVQPKLDLAVINRLCLIYRHMKIILPTPSQCAHTFEEGYIIGNLMSIGAVISINW
jgi:hypothetical protein